LAIDKIALRNGHRDFVAVISARTSQADMYVLAVLPDRLKTTLVAWLKTIPPTIRTQITTVCTDIWDGYITAVVEVLPDTRIVIDRFHVARYYREAVDALRKQEVRRLRKDLPKADQDKLKRTLWPLRKCLADLNAAEQERPYARKKATSAQVSIVC
jgi:transposase